MGCNCTKAAGAGGADAATATGPAAKGQGGGAPRDDLAVIKVRSSGQVRTALLARRGWKARRGSAVGALAPWNARNTGGRRLGVSCCSSKRHVWGLSRPRRRPMQRRNGSPRQQRRKVELACFGIIPCARAAAAPASAHSCCCSSAAEGFRVMQHSRAPGRCAFLRRAATCAQGIASRHTRRRRPRPPILLPCRRPRMA
jgi:hypothetical protein